MLRLSLLVTIGLACMPVSQSEAFKSAVFTSQYAPIELHCGLGRESVYTELFQYKSAAGLLKMKYFQKHVIDADPLTQIEQVFWRYLTRQIAESDRSATEFQIQTMEAYQSSYGHEPENLAVAARAINDILESLRTKGIWTNLNGSGVTRLGYISGSTIFPRKPEIIAFTIDECLSQLIFPTQ